MRIEFEHGSEDTNIRVICCVKNASGIDGWREEAFAVRKEKKDPVIMVVKRVVDEMGMKLF